MKGLCTLAEFKRAAEQGEELAGAQMRKQFVANVADEGGDELELAFTISTNSVDRSNERFDTSGWELDNFRKGGSILWAHQSTAPPIAKPTYVNVIGGALKARGQFTPRDLYPFGFMVYEMVKAGFLRTASVGFKVLDAVINKERGGLQRGAIDFLRQELLEWSVVPVPDNPDALVGAKDAGIDLAPLREWAQRALEDTDGPGLWLPKDVAIATIKASSGSPVSVAVPDAAGAGPSGSHAPDSLGATPGAATKTKAGRVLSQANEGRLRAAVESINGAAASIGEVLSKMGDQDDEGKSVPVPAQSVPAPQPVRDQPKALDIASLRRIVNAVVEVQVKRAVNDARGVLPD